MNEYRSTAFSSFTTASDFNVHNCDRDNVGFAVGKVVGFEDGLYVGATVGCKLTVGATVGYRIAGFPTLGF